jgi:hypothetical protein
VAPSRRGGVPPVNAIAAPERERPGSLSMTLSARVTEVRPVVDGTICTVETVSDALGWTEFEVKIPGGTQAGSAEAARLVLHEYGRELAAALAAPGALR